MQKSNTKLKHVWLKMEYAYCCNFQQKPTQSQAHLSRSWFVTAFLCTDIMSCALSDAISFVYISFQRCVCVWA